MEPNAPEPQAPSDDPEEVYRPRTGGRLGAAAGALTVGLVVGLLLIAWAGRHLFAPPAVIAGAVMLLPWLFLAVGTWTFALWSAAPDRREPPILLAVLVLVAAGLWGPTWPARGVAADGDELRVLTWNVRRLWGGPEDGGDATSCVVETIEAVAPDVITLLEVSEQDVASLQEQLSLTCVHSNYHANPGSQRGGLAACTGGEGWRLQSGSAQRFVDGEDWYYVFAEVSRGSRVVNLLSVHLYPYGISIDRLRSGVEELARGGTEELSDLTRTGRRVVKAQSDQVAALLERVQRFKDPTIIAGDFNSTRDAALHVALRRDLTDAWERGGTGLGGTVRVFDLLPMRVDYVYASDALAVVEARIPEVGCSDHRPVVTDLVLREEPLRAGRPERGATVTP